MRVYELAKKLGMENRALIPELKRLGISVASHSSALDDAAVQKALDQLTPKAGSGQKGLMGSDGDQKRNATSKAANSAREGKASGREEEVKGTFGGRSSMTAVEEAPKVDKKRILIKRKKSDEEIESEVLIAQAPAPTTAVASDLRSEPLSLESAPVSPGFPSIPSPSHPSVGTPSAPPLLNRDHALQEKEGESKKVELQGVAGSTTASPASAMPPSRPVAPGEKKRSDVVA